jgi:iron complex outermembrane recepter protein
MNMLSRLFIRSNSLLKSSILVIFTITCAHSQVLEEVVVTAQKREQSVQDVGIAITSITGSEIRELGFTSALDIATQTPGLEVSSAYGSGSSANIVIRGIGQNDFGEGHEAPVTAYIDEFYLVSVPAADFSMFDLERVEVLKGPQGTLFGRNSTGGLIHYVTAKPTKETSGFITIGGGTDSEIKAEGAISGSLSDSLAGRLSFLSHHSDGFKKNLDPLQGDGGETGTDTVRAQLLFEPSDDLSILFKAEYGEIDTIHTYYETTPLSAPDPVTGLFDVNPGGVDGAGFNENNFGAGARNVTTANSPTFLKQDSLHFALRIEKDFENFSVTSLTGYLDLDRNLAEDCDASANSICFAEFPYSTDWFTQELRFNGSTDRMRWTAGAFYLDQDAENHPRATFNIPFDGAAGVDPATGLYAGFIYPIELAGNWTMKTKSYSLYGQIEYDFADDFTFIAGIRWTKDEKDFSDVDNATLRTCTVDPFGIGNCFLVADGGSGIPNPVTSSYRDDLISFRAELDYRATEDLMLYASISQGTKGGGFNNGFYGGDIATDNSLINYGAEKNLAYEIGFKSTLMNDRMRLNGSAFYYDYEDFQAFNWIGFGGQITNSDATSKGGELELEALVTDQINVKLGVAFLDTKVKNVRGRAATYVADRDAAYAPDFTGNGSISYDFDLSGDTSVRLFWNWTYTDSRFGNNFSEPSELGESYFKHNASAIINWQDNWTLTIYGRNLSDNENEHRSFTFSDLGYRQIMYDRGRTLGASLGYSF